MDGLAATKNDEPDHKTRLEYLQFIGSMNCWSAADRMKLRSTILQSEKDRMTHEQEMTRIAAGRYGMRNGDRFMMSAEAKREMEERSS